MNSHSKALGWAALLTAAHFTAKLVGGYLTNSLALISDAASIDRLISPST